MASQRTVTVAIMSVFFIAMGIGTITPAIQDIAEAFPHLGFSTILLASTLPSLFIIPSSILAGMAAGSKVGYRTLLIWGTLLFSLAGAAPIFMSNFTTILVARALFGIGLGIIMPLGNALVLAFYEGQERANMLGLGGVMMNIGGIVLQLLGGFFSSIRWNLAFLPHLIGLVTLIMVMFMLPEPEKKEQVIVEKATIPWSVYLIAIIFGVVTMLNYPALVNMSTIIITGNLGDAASAGIVLSLFTVGGMVAGAVFGKLYQKIALFSIPVGFAVMAGGAGLVYYAGSLPILALGMAFIGMGFGWLMPAFMMMVGMVTSPEAYATASGILMAFMNLGGFLSTYYIAMLLRINSAIRFPIFVEMVALFIGALIYLILSGRIHRSLLGGESVA